MKEQTINVAGKPLGRVASEIAFILQGKDDPSYEPHKTGDTKVLIEGVEDIKLSGAKAEQKIYYSHTTHRAGRLKKKTYEQAFSEDPQWVLKNAVAGMLPKNRLRDKRLKNLVFVEVKENNKEDK